MNAFFRPMSWLLSLLLCAGAALCETQMPAGKCLSCHAKPDLARVNQEGQPISLCVNKARYVASVHGDFDCVACHTELADNQDLPHRTGLKPVDCASCHGAASQEFSISSHWRLISAAKPQAMTCATCHGKHDILRHTNPESPTHRRNIARICLRCHADQPIAASDSIKVSAYEKSVHGRLSLLEGNLAAAECVDCHGNHKIMPADNPKSSVYRPLIPATCGRCHAPILQEYRASIHGQAVERGSLDAPVCTDCHGEHTIEAPGVETSSVATEHIPETCGKCHENVVLAQKYGIAAQRFSTYQNSYHGIANKFGKTIVANCASCHGYHHILPPADPASSVHPANLAATCGRCHPHAGANFTKGKMHVQATISNSPGVFFVRRFYYLFIGALMVVFIAYMIIEYTGFIKRRGRRKG